MPSKKWEINERNLPFHEWIGLECSVSNATDSGKKGLKGRIVDETKNTVQIETQKGEKTLPKKEVELEIFLPGGKTTLKTREWCFSPENRIKMVLKRKKKENKRDW